MNLKIPCTSCSDRQPRTMHVSIACFIALLLMLLLAKVTLDVFRVWPFSLVVAFSCRFLHWTWTNAVPSWSLESILGLLHTSTQLTPLPACTYWQWHNYAPLGEHIHIQKHNYICTQICIHWHRPTKLNTHIIIALFLFRALLILEGTMALFSFTFCLHWTEYTHNYYSTLSLSCTTILEAECTMALFSFIFQPEQSLFKQLMSTVTKVTSNRTKLFSIFWNVCHRVAL